MIDQQSSKSKRKPQSGNRGIIFSLISMGFFFVITFTFFLYHSHIQLGILHGFGKTTASKQFVFNNIDMSSHQDQYTPLDSSREVLNERPKVAATDDKPSPSKLPQNAAIIIPAFNISLGKKEYSKYLSNLSAHELLVRDDAFPIDTPHLDNTKQGHVKEESLVAAEIGALTTPHRTPAHVLNCPHADLVTFWKAPIEADLKFQNPFKTNIVKYVTFEPGRVQNNSMLFGFSLTVIKILRWLLIDVGGWNNIRMQMELVLVFAAATGRTLVLPPDQPMYLLQQGSGHQKEHNFADFFPFDLISQVVPVISMKEFMEREAITGHLRDNILGNIRFPPENTTDFKGTDRISRNLMWDYLRNVTSCPTWKSMEEFVIIPPSPGVNTSLLPDAKEYQHRREIFSAGRKGFYYDDYWQRQHVIHFISKPGLGFRLLEHFYTFIHFEDPSMDRYYKRFVRNFVHYVDLIFCKSALIINKLLEEGNGYYTSFHVRR